MKKLISILLTVGILFSQATAFADYDEARVNYDFFDDAEPIPEHTMMQIAEIVYGTPQDNGDINIYPKKEVTYEESIVMFSRALGSGLYPDISKRPEMDAWDEHPMPCVELKWSAYEAYYALHECPGFIDDLCLYLITDGERFGITSIKNMYISDEESERYKMQYTKPASLKWFVTMCVRLAGYESEALEEGGYFDGYFKVALRTGILNNTKFADLYKENGLEYVQDMHFTREDMHELLDNTFKVPLRLSRSELNADKYDITKFINGVDINTEKCDGTGTFGRYENYYSLVHDIYEVVGKVESFNGRSVNFIAEESNNFNGKAIYPNEPQRLTLSLSDYVTDNFRNYPNRLCKLMVKNNEILNVDFVERLETPYHMTNTVYMDVGNRAEIYWERVPGADYYTLWNWTDNICHDGISGNFFAPYEIGSKPGTYAISIYARSRNDDEYKQSIPLSLNVYVGNPAQEKIDVTVNGQEINFDVPPQIINERTMVPLRGIFEALGATVTWNEAEQKVRAENRNHVVDFVIGATTMNVWHLDGSGPSGWMYLDSPAVIIDGRTLVPARAVAEAFNCDVQWDSQNRQVSITPRN